MLVLISKSILKIEEGNRTDFHAQLWAEKDKPFYFEVKIIAGSHVDITWEVEGVANPCGATIGVDGSLGLTDMDHGTECQFPFRYNNVLYYGCTYMDPTVANKQICATDRDKDFNGLKYGVCDDKCVRQSNDLNCS